MRFTNMVWDLKSTTSATEKKEILKDYLYGGSESGFIRFLLREAFDPNLLHNVKLKKKDVPALSGAFYLGDLTEEIRRMFDKLHISQSSQKNKVLVQNMLKHLTPDDQDSLFAVVNKKLRCGISVKTVNAVYPNLIDVAPIQLAKKYDPEKSHRYSNRFYCSNKLDGQRVFCWRSNKGWKKFSRAGDYLGNEIFTLGHWDGELEAHYKETGSNFFDGEAYLHGMKFEEIQSLVSSNVNFKDATKLQYHVFFVGRVGDLKDALRSGSVSGIRPDLIVDVLKGRLVVGVPQKVVFNNEGYVFEKIDEAVENGFEGVMLRSVRDPYETKRGNNLLKAKKSDLSGTEEITDAYVEKIEYGDFVVREDGMESVEKLPVALWVSLPGNPNRMKVGSGFTLEDRRNWNYDEDRILYKTIEVEHQGFGNHWRMRFPRYLRTREDIV